MTCADRLSRIKEKQDGGQLWARFKPKSKGGGGRRARCCGQQRRRDVDRGGKCLSTGECEEELVLNQCRGEGDRKGDISFSPSEGRTGRRPTGGYFGMERAGAYVDLVKNCFNIGQGTG